MTLKICLELTYLYLYLFLKQVKFTAKFFIWSVFVIDMWTLVHPVCELDQLFVHDSIM